MIQYLSSNFNKTLIGKIVINNKFVYAPRITSFKIQTSSWHFCSFNWRFTAKQKLRLFSFSIQYPRCTHKIFVTDEKFYETYFKCNIKLRKKSIRSTFTLYIVNSEEQLVRQTVKCTRRHFLSSCNFKKKSHILYILEALQVYIF